MPSKDAHPMHTLKYNEKTAFVIAAIAGAHSRSITDNGCYQLGAKVGRPHATFQMNMHYK